MVENGTSAPKSTVSHTGTLGVAVLPSSILLAQTTSITTSPVASSS
jgi:hypothetical protein